ncbi:MAG: hypothetical protein GQ532_08580 [Methylomarinum sp.]|nr:hypothetical protein [Methylomarinum sp.]
MKKIIANLFVVALILTASGCNNSKTTTGFLEEMRANIAINDGPARSGEYIYNYRCKTCHDRNTQGAPMPGDEYEWQLRAKKGFDLLMDHTINGYSRTLMPAKGGCRDCNETELRNAVIYMLQTSGIELKSNN